MDLFAPRHLLIILLVVLLVFGTKKLKTIGSDLGSAVRGFKKSMNEGDAEESVKQLLDDLPVRLIGLTAFLLLIAVLVMELPQVTPRNVHVRPEPFGGRHFGDAQTRFDEFAGIAHQADGLRRKVPGREGRRCPCND